MAKELRPSEAMGGDGGEAHRPSLRWKSRGVPGEEGRDDLDVELLEGGAGLRDRDPDREEDLQTGSVERCTPVAELTSGEPAGQPAIPAPGSPTRRETAAVRETPAVCYGSPRPRSPAAGRAWPAMFAFAFLPPMVGSCV